MTSGQLSLREPLLPETWRTRDRGIGQRLLQVEARCELYAMEGYYWLVDIAPVLLRYQVEQWWRDTKRSVGYLAADVMEKIDEWLG